MASIPEHRDFLAIYRYKYIILNKEDSMTELEILELIMQGLSSSLKPWFNNPILISDDTFVAGDFMMKVDQKLETLSREQVNIKTVGVSSSGQLVFKCLRRILDGKTLRSFGCGPVKNPFLTAVGAYMPHQLSDAPNPDTAVISVYDGKAHLVNKDLIDPVGFQNGITVLASTLYLQDHLFKLTVSETKKGCGITTYTDPSHIKKIFKDREISPGKCRREALQHIVSSYKRFNHSEDDYTFVKTYLRGKTECFWNGYLITIISPDLDKYEEHVKEIKPELERRKVEQEQKLEAL
jgi:hypothetical protein